jgi:uncharacterized protein YjbJ (UPF0337 family)
MDGCTPVPVIWDMSVDLDQRRLLGARRNVAKGALLVIGGRNHEDRIVGSAKQVKDTVKQVVGKAVGGTKLQSEAKADKIEGEVQNVIGGLKDTLKGK